MQWCNNSPGEQQKCNSLVQAGLGDSSKFMEAESVTRALSDATEGFKNLAKKEGILSVMSFLCEPTLVAWWPADPVVGPSPRRISDGPVSKLAHDLRGKTMLMVPPKTLRNFIRGFLSHDFLQRGLIGGAACALALGLCRSHL